VLILKQMERIRGHGEFGGGMGCFRKKMGVVLSSHLEFVAEVAAEHGADTA